MLRQHVAVALTLGFVALALVMVALILRVVALALTLVALLTKLLFSAVAFARTSRALLKSIDRILVSVADEYLIRCLQFQVTSVPYLKLSS